MFYKEIFFLQSILQNVLERPVYHLTQQTSVGLEDVLKTSSRHVLKTPSIRLQRNNFTSSRTSWRRLEDVLQSRFEDVLKTSSRRLQEKLLRWRRLEGVLKTCLKDVLKTCHEDVLQTCLEDVLKTCHEDLLKILWRQTKYLLEISVNLSRDLTNLNVYLTSLYFTNLYLTTLKRIQNALITGDWFGVMKLA